MSLADHKGTEEEAWELKKAFSVFVVKLYGFYLSIVQDLKNIKNIKGCRDGMPKSMQTR